MINTYISVADNPGDLFKHQYISSIVIACNSKLRHAIDIPSGSFIREGMK